MFNKVLIENYQEYIHCEMCQERDRVDFDCPVCGKFSKNACFIAEDSESLVQILYCNHCAGEFKRTNEFNENNDEYWELVEFYG